MSNVEARWPRFPLPKPEEIITMRYMLLIYTREDLMAQNSPEEMQQVMNGHIAAMREAQAKGVMRQAEPLQKTPTAKTLRMENGRPVVIDGPFAETKEQLAGYYILDCKDMDEALAWAEKIPTGCGGKYGCIEVRPLREIPTNILVQQPEYSTIECNG
jgi:hypothetical protein